MLKRVSWELLDLIAEGEPSTEDLVVPRFVPRDLEAPHRLPRTILPAEIARIASFDVLARLAIAAEAHDPYTGKHLENIRRFTTSLARALGCSDAFVQEIELASLMHDVGKIGVPKILLTRNAALDTDERRIMQQHPVIGERLLSSPGLEMAREVCRSHHERWDGSGYPDGLRRDDIPLSARIVAVVDVFDALTSVRPYKAAWPLAEAFAFIHGQAGSHFDPDIVDAFLGDVPRPDQIVA